MKISVNDWDGNEVTYNVLLKWLLYPYCVCLFVSG